MIMLMSDHNVSETIADCYLSPFLSAPDSPQYQLATVLDSHPESYGRMLQKLFHRQPVTETEFDADIDGDQVILLDDDNTVIATSPIHTLSETILLVNSDLYRTGGVELTEIDVPDVIEVLADTVFHARGFPESNYEKLPLILISRQIERLSYEHGGTHRASFQRLSRIQDERGTANVYRKLSDQGVNTHVYGVPDDLPPRELDVSIHAGFGGDWDVSWFVLHRSETAAAALVALETGVNEWEARWTYERETVEEIEDVITKYL
jgi:hypothetical protein